MAKNRFVVLAVLLLFFFSLFLGMDRFMYRKSLHFSFSRIALFREKPEWNFFMLNVEEQKEIDQIFNQNFTFFEKGSHAYLFLSEDNKYMLKLLKQNMLCPKNWLAYIPVSFNPYYQEYCQKQKKIHKMLTAFKIASTELKEETGLVYIHLNPTQTLNKKLILVDKHGKKHTIDPNNMSFYLQKRAQLIYVRISELMRTGNLERAKNIISSVFALIAQLENKGIHSGKMAMYKNFGIIDDKAVQIDIGVLRKQTGCTKQPISTLTHNFRDWIEKNYPALLPHFDAELEHINPTCPLSCPRAERNTRDAR